MENNENKKDFIEMIRRTRESMEQYRNNLRPGDKSYDRTLFLNSCLTLLLITKAEIYDKLPDESISTWGIKEERFTTDKKTVKEIARHLRNAMAHSRFDFDTTPGVIVDNITFYDVDRAGQENFRTTLKYKEFVKFVLKLTDSAIDIRKQQEE